MLKRLFTKNLKEIPLLWVNFNYKHFKDKGKENSCMLYIHPNLADDVFIKRRLEDLVEYIRDNYDMSKM